jgi:diguanylate cyclase (GGDEF)-like protein
MGRVDDTRSRAPRGHQSVPTEIDRWAEEESDPSAMRRYGLMAAGLLFAGGIAAIPNNLLNDQDPTIYLLVLLALISGGICLLVPWHRLSRHWLHLVGAVGSIEVLLSVWFGDPIFAWYYIFVVVFAAYAFQSRVEVAIQLAFAILMMMTPFITGYDEVDHQVADLAVQVPSLILAAVVIVALREQLERGREAYRLLSRRDPLTSVGNYRALHEGLTAELARHWRSQRRFALILVDLDDFKSVNDQFGHLAGDQVLRDVAAVLVDSIRPGDTIARHGGDEFSVIAPEVGAGEAGTLALRLEQAVPRVIAGDTKLSASSGCAIYPDDGGTVDELIAAADEALKREKRARRSLTEAAEPGASPGPATVRPRPA